MIAVSYVEDYCKYVDAIIELLEEHQDKFHLR